MSQNKTNKNNLFSGQLTQKPENRDPSTVADVDVNQFTKVLMENLKDAIVIVDLKGRGLFANKAAEKLAGYNKKEMLGNSIRKIILPQYWRLCDRLTQLALSGRSVPYCEMAIRRKDGKIIDVETGGQLVRSKNGSIFGILIITRDISRTKKAETSLRDNEERYQNLFENSPNSLLELDFSQIKKHIDDLRDSGVHDFSSYFEKHPNAVSDFARMIRIIDVNSIALRRYGVRTKEELQKNLLNILSEESCVTFRQELITIAKGKTKFESEAITQTLKGKNNSIVIMWSTAPGYEKTYSRVFVSLNDVSKCKQMEEAMKRSEARFKSLVESSGFGVAITDFDGRFTFVNKTLCRMIGYSKKEIIGKNFPDFLHKEDEPKIASIFLDAWAHPDGKPRLEFRAIHKNGHTVHMYSTPTFYRINGRIAGFSAILVDITEHKKKERLIHENREKFERLFFNNPEAAVYVDSDFRILEINSRFTKLFGYALDEITGKHLAEVIVPNDLVEESEILGKKSRQGYVNHDTNRKRKDGTLIPVSVSAAPIIVNEQLLGYIGLYRDITERKKAERALKESEERFRGITERSFDVIATLNPEGIITYISPSVKRMTGREPKEIIGKPFHNFFAQKESPVITQLLKETLNGKVFENLQCEIPRKDGTIITIEVSGSRVLADGKVIGVQGVGRDITERKKAQNALRESEERYRNLVENIPEVVYCSEISEKPKLVFLSKRIEEITGYPCEGFLRDWHFWGKLVHPDDREKMHSEMQRAISSNSCFNCEYRLRHKDGTERFVMDLAIPLKAEGGVQLFQGILIDITDRKELEERLSTLNFYGGKLNTVNSFEEIFELVLDAMDKILGFDYAEVNLNDEGTLRVVSQRGYKGSIYNLRLDSETIGIVGKAAKLRKPILVSDVRADKDYLAGYPGALSELAVPIMGESEVLGVLNVEGTELNAFDEKDITLLEILASHTATALSNLRRREVIKEALRQARESEQKHRDLFENARDLILTTDIEGHITSVNRVLSETGYDRSEVIGQSVFNFVSEKNVQDLRASFQRLFDGKSAKGELQIKSKRGTEATVEYNGNVIKQNGEVAGFQVIVRDCTQRKQMEEKLKQYSTNLEELVKKRTEELLESERKYSILVEESSDGVAIIQDGNIVFINKRGLNLLQYSKDEVIGTPFEKFATKQYRRLVKERCRPHTKQENAPPTYEASIVTRKGEEIVTEICAKTIRYKGQPAVLCVFRDIHERKQAEEQRRRLEKMAIIGEVATMVAHDLRNPLTAIRNAGYYIKRACPHQANAECGDVLEMLNIIEQETIFADNIINDLLGFTAKESAQKQKQDINKLLESSLNRLSIPSGIEIEKNFSKDANVVVDGKQIERLFVNLIRNAVQAMFEGGRLTITTRKEENQLTVEIADTGVGVPKENMNKLFQPLFTTKSKGIGLGLAISKRIATQHAGTIDVTSEVGKGTTFTLRLPIVLGAASK